MPPGSRVGVAVRLSSCDSSSWLASLSIHKPLVCILLVVDLAFTALPCSSVASPGCSPSLLGTELTILRGRGAAYSKEVLATWTRANGIGSIGSNLSYGLVTLNCVRSVSQQSQVFTRFTRPRSRRRLKVSPATRTSLSAVLRLVSPSRVPRRRANITLRY